MDLTQSILPKDEFSQHHKVPCKLPRKASEQSYPGMPPRNHKDKHGTVTLRAQEQRTQLSNWTDFRLTQEGTHAWNYKPGQMPRARKDMGFGKLSTASLRNCIISKLSTF